MNFRVFSYPIPCDEGLPELNGFLGSHRVLRVREEFVSNGASTCLVFVVEYLDVAQQRAVLKGEPKVDYRKELSEEEFAVFSHLR